MVWSLVVGLLPALITGCATITAAGPPYSPAPMPEEGYALAYIYRPFVPIAGARIPTVYINGMRICDLPSKGYTWLHLKAGESVIGVKWPKNVGIPTMSMPVNLSAGNTYYFRVVTSAESIFLEEVRSDIHVVDAVIAREELSQMRLVEPSVSRLP